MDVSQYLEIFIDESSEHLQTLSDCIMVLEKEPDNKDTINEVFRAAHSLKGMAGTMGFKRMQHLTHDMENVFQEVRSERISVDSSMIDLLFKCLDAIDQYIENVKNSSDEGTEDNELIIKELNDFIAKANGQAVEEAAPATNEGSAEEENENTSDELQINLNEDEMDTVKSSIEGGQKVYGVKVTVSKECLLKAARAFLVFRAVEEFGQIIVYHPSSQDIEDEKFEQDFGFYIATNEDEDKIVAAVKSVSEIESVLVKEVSLTETQQEEVPAPVVEEKKEEPQKAQETAPAPVSQKNAPKKAAAKPVTNRTVRVDIEKLDALMNQVSELIIAKNSLVSISGTDGSNSSQTFHEQIEYLERITTNLHESVMKVRMVPIESVVSKFPRMIRDLSRSLNKKMELVMTGEDTELDRTVVDEIGDPLMHMLRNSADHGRVFAGTV